MRSPFSLDAFELVAAVGTGIVAWLGFRYILLSTGPWYDLYPSSEVEQLPVWFVQSRTNLFDDFAASISIITAISVIFLLRAVRDQKLSFLSVRPIL